MNSRRFTRSSSARASSAGGISQPARFPKDPKLRERKPFCYFVPLICSCVPHSGVAAIRIGIAIARWETPCFAAGRASVAARRAAGAAGPAPNESTHDVPRDCRTAGFQRPPCPLWVKSGLMHCSKTLSLNNLVRQCEHRWRHSDAKRSGGLELDDKLIFFRLLHRQLGGLCALDGSPAICRASSSGSFRSTACSYGRMR